ncbi:MAG: TerB family tellurite resistance protein [Cyclobacteriaceae bacterium]|jgi:hypothetical protein|nr:TerB family tellurite resistance protein [Cyclobacteriaceae bacterium]
MVALQQLKLLISLAKLDGEIGEQERKYILNIGTANGFLVAEILPMFIQEHRLTIPDDLTADEKFEYLYSLVQLMKVDEKLYAEEIKFCGTVATKLGYKPELMFELMLKVKGPQTAENKEELRALAQTFLTD